MKWSDGEVIYVRLVLSCVIDKVSDSERVSESEWVNNCEWVCVWVQGIIKIVGVMVHKKWGTMFWKNPWISSCKSDKFACALNKGSHCFYSQWKWWTLMVCFLTSEGGMTSPLVGLEPPHWYSCMSFRPPFIWHRPHAFSSFPSVSHP